MEFKDYYATLGVEPSAGDAEIKTAYRRLARKYHPDVSKEAGAEDKFKAINEAYEALRDPPKRAAYDQLRAQGYRPGEEFQAPPNYGGAQGYDFEEVFGNGGAGGGFSDFFESLFARQQRARQGGAGPGPGPGPGAGPAPRGDTRAKLAVPLEAVYSGDSVRITINGRQLDVRVPKGVRPGQVIRLSGQGNGGSNLLLEIEYAAHPQFEVDGLNILYTLPVTPWQAALGTSISVPTLGGAVELKIPPESDAGRKLRLRGRGLPGTPAGDQIVELEVLAPAPETEAQRKAYRGLAKAFGEVV
ncbi:cytochrome C biogenesis protein [Xanthomonas translucens pv. arrhenatheri]|uniref:Curved DNA binding protein n=2 Tax=Xanthomonas translucens group TaxID=3390202 RepID=A0A0K2ZQR8_9XANT|nr:DnaJ C-terminal domain-containing protein [Xanthomonas translucens]OAX66745.1 cytochrome C biogenesis protein [Xanthomonas translucens pv. arrhenatheri]UKE78578.1 DnaJ domain-containing protein [Xanthomonas translucens pv. arrhenatheri]CTP87958.1 curved DNA binding protein [Xanthomonas translucens pv. arrhenatheri LMG 727]